MNIDKEVALKQITIALNSLRTITHRSRLDLIQQSESTASSTISRLAATGSSYHKQLDILLTERWETDPSKIEVFVTSRIQRLIGMLESLRSDYLRQVEADPKSDIPAFKSIERMLLRFHQVVLQLAKRHDHRDTLRIFDEYDVQDLLYALLKLEIDDIRPEEHTPSYAGKSTRMDFLLKKQRIVVEVKMTRDSLRDKQIGDELLLDIARYASHPDCSTLICFIYDPQCLLNNPAGLKNDLEAMASEGLTVAVVICQH